MAPFKQTTVPAHWLPPQSHSGRGAPTDYRPEFCEMVEEAMANEGISLTAFAGMIRKDPSTVYDWIRRHSEFAHAVARARAARTLWLERKLLRSRKGAETTASIFALKNACPQEWQDIRHTEHKHTIEAQVLTDAQLYAIASGQHASDAATIDASAIRINEKPATD